MYYLLVFINIWGDFEPFVDEMSIFVVSYYLDILYYLQSQQLIKYICFLT